MKRFTCCICLLLSFLVLAGCVRTNAEDEPSENIVEMADISDVPDTSSTPTASVPEVDIEPTILVPTPTTTPSDVEAETEPTPVPTPTPTPRSFDVNDVKMQATPQSSCFSEVGYDSEWEILVVQFRDSSSVYTYSSFPKGEWDKFISADSLGRWFNKYIKGNYDCERIS